MTPPTPLTADVVFAHPGLRVWRSLDHRRNATLDLPTGRVHVKLYDPPAAHLADAEVAAIALLNAAAIPTLTLAGHGRTADGRAFTASHDLAGYQPADGLLTSGYPFDRLLRPTADLVAKLHSAGLHHRDLYHCHLFVRPTDADVRLIDVARVRRLPGWPLRRRWVVKDLAAVWYSNPLTDAERLAWLTAYGTPALESAIRRKAARIAQHDARLNVAQPTRNVSISSESPPESPQ